MHFKMTLRTKASLLIAGIITLSIVITGGFNLRLLDHSIRKSIYDGLESVSGTTSQVISRFLSDTLKEAQAVALALPVEALEKKDIPVIEEKLKGLFEVFPKFENGMFILDAQGRLWVDYPRHPALRGRVFAFREYYKKTLALQTGVIGIPYRSARTEMPVLTFTAVLRGSAGQVIGILGCSVQLNSPRALEGIRLTKIGKTGYIYVYDSSRLMILHPKEKRLLKRDVPKGANKLFDAALEGFEGVGETVNSRGVSMLLSIKQIPSTDWIIGAQQPKLEAFAPIQEARRQIFYSVITAVILSILIGAIAIRGITKPLLKLRKATILFGQTGDSGAEDDEKKAAYKRELESIKDEGEIGALAETFGKISRKLDQTIQSLKTAARDWELTFDSVSEGILIVDKENRLLRLNRSAAEFFDIEPESVLGRSLDSLIQKDSDKTGSGPLPLITVSGKETERTLEMSSTPLLDESGQIIGTVYIAKDITAREKAEAEKRRLESQLHQAQRLESIGTLAGGIAHDFNNLLMGIQGNASLLEMNLDSSHPSYDRLQQIEESIQRGASLSRQLLGFARGGRYEVKRTNVNDLIKRSLDMFGRTRKEISIQTRLQEHLWTIEADPGQIDQVLLNLYVNSWQAMPNGGMLFVQTENIILDETYVEAHHLKAGDYVKISIADTGTGMDKKTQDHIFDPFFTTKEMGHGTGLGLASSYGIVKSHNGLINVYSESGHGATFNIYLPASRGSLPEEKPDNGEKIERGTEIVLLVDDEAMILDVGRGMLEKLGYTVLTARSGMEAVRMYREYPEQIDIVVLDMIMPDMGGGDTYDRLKSIQPKIKVLLSSGYSLDSAASDIIARGCSGFIQKPFNLEQISRKLRAVLDCGDRDESGEEKNA